MLRDHNSTSSALYLQRPPRRSVAHWVELMCHDAMHIWRDIDSRAGRSGTGDRNATLFESGRLVFSAHLM